ncbi:uncharacterized protein LOC130697392 [Daphnia carinata]|uniref:uncharacterized protein LOC130697392 n=1 Tax=Daphnia carinata TaxID=120202 RepID=UPI002579AA84|nr:uncharacterized protein LOC130697392 [Daphnia carinata]XP_057376279.1 uncharacterized protein LOC130697392 [Daphnia carinata]
MKTVYLAAITMVLVMLSSTCRADDDVIDAVAISERKYIGADSMSLLHKLSSGTVKGFNATSRDRSSRQKPSVWPELISRLPVSGLFDFGAKALNIARFWPAGLASLVVGTAPTTGAVVGVVAISIFIIVIWLVIYSIGVLPVGAALLGRQDFGMDSPYAGHPGMMLPQMAQQPFQGPYPYNQRFQRSLADASRSVMDAIGQFESKNQ